VARNFDRAYDRIEQRIRELERDLRNVQGRLFGPVELDEYERAVLNGRERSLKRELDESYAKLDAMED
jgi:hypothetical protein